MWKDLWDKLKNSKIFWAVVVGLALFGGGYGLGLHHKVPAQIVEKKVEDVETKKQLVEAQKVISSLQSQLTVAQNQITDLKTHVKTVVHIVKQKDGTVVVDKSTETDTNKHTDEKTNTTATTNSTTVATDDKKVDTDTKSHTDITKITTPLIKDKYYLGLSAGLSLKGIGDPGLEFKYRVFDLGRVSIWSGAELIIPVPDFKAQNIQGRLSLGVSF